MTDYTLRIDSRLLHGQVVEAWLPALKTNAVLIVDDATAKNSLSKSAMELALPPGVSLYVSSIEETRIEQQEGEPMPLILVGNVESLSELLVQGRLPTSGLHINVGMLHDLPERRSIVPGVHMSEPEICALQEISRSGLPVEIRSLPSHSPVSPDEALEIFFKRSAQKV